MALNLVSIGTTANDGQGDPARSAFGKVNDNFAELYGRSIVAGAGLTGGGVLDSDLQLALSLGGLTVDPDAGDPAHYVAVFNGTSTVRVLVSDFLANSGGEGAVGFGTVAVSGQDDVVADAAAGTLTMAAGANITITTDAGTDTVTIAATGDTGYVTVQEEGSGLTARATMNFVGAGVTAADDAGNTRTNVTLHATLNSLAGVALTANKLLYMDGTPIIALADLTAFGRSLAATADAMAAKTLLGVETFSEFFMVMEVLDPIAGQRYTFARKPGFTGQINALVHVTNQGTCTGDVEIDGVDVTSLTSIGADSSETTTNPSGANTWTADQRIEWNCTAVTGGVQKLTLTLQCERT